MKRGRHEYVIDGYNLVHCLFPGREKTSLEQMRNDTEKLLLAFYRTGRNPLTVVYDGKGRFREHASGAPLHIVFTPARKSADLWIVDYVKSLNTKIKLVTIVSSDNELRTYASAFGARCMKSEAFAKLLHGRPGAAGSENSRQLAAGDKNDGPVELCEMEIDRWRQLFLKGKQ